jgi:hypothetical protein
VAEMSELREAELRASGWSDAEIRDYRRGYEKAGAAHTKFAAASYPTQPAPLPSHTAVQAPRVIAGGDRGTWARTTIAGMIASVVSPDAPDEAAKELAAAREWSDSHEFTYGRRPSLSEAKMAVGRRTDGVTLGGTAADIGRVFAQAGLPYAILSEVQPLPGPGAVITQPTVRG